jgi:hypothetical protein
VWKVFFALCQNWRDECGCPPLPMNAIIPEGWSRQTDESSFLPFSLKFAQIPRPFPQWKNAKKCQIVKKSCQRKEVCFGNLAVDIFWADILRPVKGEVKLC